MIEIAAAPLVLAAAGGVLIGILYFGVLWCTVRRITSARHAAALVTLSFVLRAALAAGGLVFVSGGEPLPLVAAVLGVLAGRTILIRAVGKPLRREDDAANAEPGSRSKTALKTGSGTRRA